MTDALDDWIAKARSVTIRSEMTRRGLWTKRHEGDNGNPCPCPGCGGENRFAVNVRKNLFNCRQCGAAGDAIAFVMNVDSCSFLEACEILNGEPAPGRAATETEEKRAKRERDREERVLSDAKRQAEEAENDRAYRDRERHKARQIWDRSVPIAGTMAEDYLRLRGVEAGPGARLRFLAKALYWVIDGDKKAPRLVHQGPALVGGIIGRDGLFAGVQQKWIDLSQPKGKAVIIDNETGEVLEPRKIRGGHKGGYCPLALCTGPVRRMFIGEGFETVLAVFCALLRARSPLLEGAEFRAALSLNNMAGLANGSVFHPHLTQVDAIGRVRRKKVKDDSLRPVNDDWPMMPLPEETEDVFLLGDGDSEPIATSYAMLRAAKRYSRAYPKKRIRLAWPREGLDFDDQWNAERKGATACQESSQQMQSNSKPEIPSHC